MIRTCQCDTRSDACFVTGLAIAVVIWATLVAGVLVA